MSLSTYWRITKELLLEYKYAFRALPTLEKQFDALKEMSEDKLYVENVRQFYDIPKKNAEFLCELGVREGVFEKRVGFLCNNCRGMIYSAKYGTDIPGVLTCDNCQDVGHDSFEFETESLDDLTFYVLVENV
jgi:hypothetical protein